MQISQWNILLLASGEIYVSPGRQIQRKEEEYVPCLAERRPNSRFTAAMAASRSGILSSISSWV